MNVVSTDEESLLSTGVYPAPALLKQLVDNSYVILRQSLPGEVKKIFELVQAEIDRICETMKTPGASKVNDIIHNIKTKRSLFPPQCNRLIRAACGNVGTIESIVDGVALEKVKSLIGAKPFRRANYGIFPAAPTVAPRSPFHWHNDGHYDGLKEFSINFWIPMRSCGVDAPGLMMVRASDDELRNKTSSLPQILNSDGWEWHTTVDWPAVTDKHMAKVFGADRLLAPQFDLGDIVIFTNRNLHRTDVTPDMTFHRSAIVMRYTVIGTNRPSPWRFRPQHETEDRQALKRLVQNSHDEQIQSNEALRAEAEIEGRNAKMLAHVLRLDQANNNLGILAYLKTGEKSTTNLVYCLYGLITDGRVLSGYMVAKMLVGMHIDNPTVHLACYLGGAFWGNETDELQGATRLTQTVARLKPAQREIFRTSIAAPVFRHALASEIVRKSRDIEMKLLRMQEIVMSSPDVPNTSEVAGASRTAS